MDRRLAEAARLGFTCAVVPAGTGAAPGGLSVLPAADIGSALQVLRRISQNDPHHDTRVHRPAVRAAEDVGDEE